MLMIQGKMVKIVDRKIKKSDQVCLQIGDVSYIGCIDMVISVSDRTMYIMSTKKESIHFILERKSATGVVYKDYLFAVIYSPDGVTHHTSDEFKLIRQHSPSVQYDISIGNELDLITTEKVTEKAERALTIEDKLKYVNDGCMYDILYVSPQGNMIIKEQKSGEERVVNKKDRQLQIALGIRNA